MSRPDYNVFSKRLHRTHNKQKHKHGVYNFEKTKEYTIAEKWFEERKAYNREPVPVPVPVPVLKRQRSDSCDLELKIPSYDDFNYVDPDEIVTPPPQINFDLSGMFGEVQYSTPYIEESFSDEDCMSYDGQLSEFESHEDRYH